MDTIAKEVFDAISSSSTKHSSPIDIIKTGVELLQPKPIEKSLKKEVLKGVIKKIAYGNDGLPNTADDRLSHQTTEILIMLVETDIVSEIIDSIAHKVKKVAKHHYGGFCDGVRSLFSRYQ